MSKKFVKIWILKIDPTTAQIIPVISQNIYNKIYYYVFYLMLYIYFIHILYEALLNILCNI